MKRHKRLEVFQSPASVMHRKRRLLPLIQNDALWPRQTPTSQPHELVGTRDETKRIKRICTSADSRR